MALAEADYLQHYIAERARDPKKTHDIIVAELAKTHAITTGSKDAVKAFTDTYGHVSALKESTKGTTTAQNAELSENILPTDKHLQLRGLI